MQGLRVVLCSSWRARESAGSSSSPSSPLSSSPSNSCATSSALVSFGLAQRAERQQCRCARWSCRSGSCAARFAASLLFSPVLQGHRARHESSAPSPSATTSATARFSSGLIAWPPPILPPQSRLAQARALELTRLRFKLLARSYPVQATRIGGDANSASSFKGENIACASSAFSKWAAHGPLLSARLSLPHLSLSRSLSSLL